MGVAGVCRRINKSLSTVFQVVIIICIVHFIGMGIIGKGHKRFRLGLSQSGQEEKFVPSPRKGISHLQQLSHGVGGKKAVQRLFKASFTTTSTTTTTTKPPPPDDVIEEENNRRLEILRKGCARWGLRNNGTPTVELSAEELAIKNSLPRIPMYQLLYVSEKRHFSYCPILRTGANWFSKRLLELTGEYDTEDIRHLRRLPLLEARNKFGYLSSWEMYPTVLAQCTNILVVRHPFDRLIASFRSMLEDANADPANYNKYGQRIKRLYRKKDLDQREPTFEEFVMYITKQDDRQLHDSWIPQSKRCTPCYIPFNVIEHYEHLWYETLWAFKKAGLPHSNTTDYISYSLTPEIRANYFSELTLDQVIELYNKFKLDFDLFGYNLDEYISVAQQGDVPVDPKVMDSLPLERKEEVAKEDSEELLDNNGTDDDNNTTGGDLEKTGIKVFINTELLSNSIADNDE